MSDWTLHLGDCLDPVTGLASLADLSVDCTITDPPYEAEAHTKQRRYKDAGWRAARETGTTEVTEAPLTFAAITEAQRLEVAAQIGRVTRLRAIVFCQGEAIGDWRRVLDAAGLVYRRSIPWVKPDAMPSLHGRWPGQSYEAIVLAMRPSAGRCPIGGKARYYEHTRQSGGGKNPHPTTKPLPLMLQIIRDFTSPGDLVLDPYAGSGTTGAACRQLGRRFVGWELNSDYHAIATRRIAGERAVVSEAQPDFFTEAQ